MENKDIDEGKEKLSNQEKNPDEHFNAILPITGGIGTVVGLFLFIKFGNILYFMCGLVGGLLLGLLLSSIKSGGGIKFTK